MSARDNYPKAEYAGADLHWCVTLHVAHYAAAMDEIDGLRVERDTLTAELAALRTALVKLKRADHLATHCPESQFDLRATEESACIDDLLALVPDDNWGLAPHEEGKQ